MFIKCLFRFSCLAAIVALFGLMGCGGGDRITEPAPFPSNAEVFMDDFGAGATFEAFSGSKLDAVQMSGESYLGSRSLVITVPDLSDPAETFAGGAFTTNPARDLSGYNALTFWAKAEIAMALNTAGIGNDNTGTSKYTAEASNLEIGTDWQKYIIPIPAPEKLTHEQGLFYFAEGTETGSSYLMWFDEIQFEDLGTISDPDPTIPDITKEVEVDDTVRFTGATVTYNIDGDPLTLSAMQGYFTFTSSNESVVAVDSNGVIIAVGIGSAIITAKLGTVDALGSITVKVSSPSPTPDTPAPTPLVPEADVISLYSDAYTDITVDTWSADWPDDAEYADEMIGADNVKRYYELVFAGIEFTSEQVNASGMTRFHMDIWTPNSTASPAQFKVKLVDFGADGVSNYPEQGDDSEAELTFTKNTSPGLATGTWISIDVALSAFSGLSSRAHLAQLIISGDLSTVYVDNIYFYDDGPLTAPKFPAPTPDKDPGDVVSIFSDIYIDEPVDTWSASWDLADVEDYMVGSDATKKYTNLTSAGIEFKTPTIDASAMTHFHMDVWTPDVTAFPSVFRVKLVDYGANGVYDGGGNDDVEHQITFDESTMKTGIWVSIDVPFSDFVNLTTRGHLSQLIISGDPDTVYIDNIYFYDSGIPEAPSESAPMPTVHADSVISIFSDAYTSKDFDTWSSPYDEADVYDVTVGSDNFKKYTNLVFSIAEYTTSGTSDLTSMTHFHIDVWTPIPTLTSSKFKIKLVDYGADGVWSGSGTDDVEHELTFDQATMSTGSWVSLDIPLTEFAGMTTKAHFAQMILSGTYGTVFVDNVYFHQ